MVGLVEARRGDAVEDLRCEVCTRDVEGRGANRKGRGFGVEACSGRRAYCWGDWRLTLG